MNLYHKTVDTILFMYYTMNNTDDGIYKDAVTILNHTNLYLLNSWLSSRIGNISEGKDIILNIIKSKPLPVLRILRLLWIGSLYSFTERYI